MHSCSVLLLPLLWEAGNDSILISGENCCVCSRDIFSSSGTGENDDSGGGGGDDRRKATESKVECNFIDDARGVEANELLLLFEPWLSEFEP